MADDEPPLTHRGQRVGLAFALIVITLAILLGRGGITSAQLGPRATATEKVVTQTATPTPSATVVPPSPTSTPTPTPTITHTPTLTPTGPRPYEDWAVDQYGPPWDVDCDNEDIYDGYKQGAWARDFCVPGIITQDAYWHTHPPTFYGLMSSYGPGVMEAQLRHRKIDEGKYKDGIALMSCAYIGHTAWLRRPGFGWDGPFVVVDCSQKNHMYYHYVGMGLVVEVGYKTTERWGAKVLQRVDVHIGPSPGGSGIYLPYWWVENKLEWEGAAAPPAATATQEPD